MPVKAEVPKSWTKFAKEDILDAKELLQKLGYEPCDFMKWKKSELIDALKFMQREHQIRTNDVISLQMHLGFLRNQIAGSSILQLIRLRGLFKTLETKDLNSSDDK